MKLYFLFPLLLSLACGVVLAAPYPIEGKLVTWTQPDGTTMELRVFGDEFYGRTETLEGHTVVFDEARMAYCYASPVEGGADFKASEVLAHKPAPKGLARHLKLDRQRIAEIRSQRAGEVVKAREERWNRRVETVNALRNGAFGAPFEESAARAAAEVEAAPVLGQIRGLTLIVQFPNDSSTAANDPIRFPTTKEKIERYCNNVGYKEDGNTGSIRDYFYDQSLGKLTYIQKVSTIVTLPKARNYYNFADYPANQTLRDPSQAGTLIIRDAVTILRNQGFDFSGLTANAANLAVATNVFFAGNNSGVWARGLWPHQSQTATPVDLGPTGGGISLSQYQITDIPNAAPEIGTFCHENGHLILDFPDLYDYGGDSAGIGLHGLMAAGNNLNNGRTPAPINVYFKDMVGWASVTELAPTDAVTMSLPSTGNKAVRIRKPGTATEFFMFENRGGGDKWAQYVPDKGIAIWHVDEKVRGNNNQQMTSALHYQVSLQQADGNFDLERDRNFGDGSDLFDVSRPLFSGTSLPDSRWWNSAMSGVRARIESVAGANMSVTFGDLPPNTIALSTPNGGEVAFRNAPLRIDWESNISGNVRIELLKDGSRVRTIVNNTPNTKRYEWILPDSLETGTGYQVRVSSLTNPVPASDLSDLTFRITPATFPKGGKMPIGWQKPKGANGGFVLTASGAFEGKHALRSANIGDGETAAIQYQNLFQAGTISFHIRASSETGHDLARFYIDGKPQKLRGSATSLSGDGDWVSVAIPITAGHHTLMWTYEKDESYGDASDTTWIDGVALPLAPAEIDVKSWSGRSLISGVEQNQMGSAKVGTTYLERTLEITNFGEDYLGALKASITGRNARDFRVVSFNASPLQAGQSSKITVLFSPVKPGQRIADLVIRSNDADENPFIVRLGGEGLAKKKAATKPKKKKKKSQATLAAYSAGFVASSADVVTVSDTGSLEISGDRYLTLTVDKSRVPSGLVPRIEVSGDLLDWASGPIHTTIVRDNHEILRVRDNTPVTGSVKRYIRVRFIPD